MPPTYLINNGAKIQVQAIGRLHGQRTRTTFWYLYTGENPITDGATGLADLLDDFHVNVGSFILERASAEWTYEYNQAQMTFPVRYRAVVDQINEPGAQPGQSCPSATAVVVKRQGILATRAHQGRIFLPGVPVLFEDNSLLKADEIPNYVDLEAGMLATLVTSNPLETFVPIVSAVAGGGELNTVITASVTNVLRYQRRREVGVGE